MSENRNIYQVLLRYTGFLIFSLSFGIFVTLIVSDVENMVQEKKIKEDTKNKIEGVAAAYRYSEKGTTPEKTAAFLKNFIVIVMQDRVVAVDATRGRQKINDAKHLYTFIDEPVRLDIYIKKSYLKKTAHAIDPPDLIEGFIVTLVVLTSLVLYSERKRQTLAIRKRYETETAELTKALQKHEALALLGRMTATLAHELKTPVATISNLIHVLPSRINDQKFTKRFISITNEELRRTQQLIDNLLVYGKEIPDIDDEWVNLETFLGGMAESIGLKVAACPKTEIYGDRFYLRLFFENIMRNSLQAGAKEVFVKVEKEDSATGILFEDNGAGYPADAELSELINPFVTSRSSGAGLGLFLAQKIALAHEGIITLYRAGEGAGVKLSLPSKRVWTNG